MGRYGRAAAFLVVAALILIVVGCGDDNNGNNQVSIDIKNLSRITAPDFTYAAWVRQTSTGNVSLLDRFNTGLDNTIRFTRFALLGTLVSGDEVFVTIEPVPQPDPSFPSQTVVLTGDIQNNTAVLTFPRIEDFTNTTGFATVSGGGNRQLLTEFFDLPDVSDRNFIYQGFLQVGDSFFPLSRFSFNQVPVSDTATLDATTARYILAVEPVPDVNPGVPFSIQPFFTNGNLQPFRQSLVKSSLTPGQSNFRFPSAVATIR